MSDIEPVARHHKLYVKDTRAEILEDYCYNALQIPVGTIARWARLQDYDSYEVTLINGYKLVVSSIQLYQFDADRTNCER